MQLRFTAVLFGLLAIGPLLSFGCSGGQTGVPSAAHVQVDCADELVHLDASTALGFPPSALWDAYEGRYESLAEWQAAIGDPADAGDHERDRTRVTIEVSRRGGTKLETVEMCRSRGTNNSVRVPVLVRISSEDGVVSVNERTSLRGDLDRALVILPDDDGSIGSIELVPGRARVELYVTGGPAPALRSIEEEP